MTVHTFLRMGARSSKKREEDDSDCSWTGPPGKHSPYPMDYILYPGPELLYCFIDIMANYKIMRNNINLGPQVVTTNVETFLGELMECYDSGFMLKHFVKVPGVKSTTVVTNWTDKQPYQAILTKPVKEKGLGAIWELKIEKGILSTRALATTDDEHYPGEHYESQDPLISTIHSYAARGARLVCAQPIGYVRSQSTNEQYAVMGVDLFFNVPRHPNPKLYVYHTIKVSAKYYIQPDATQTIQQIECDADWMGQMKLFLVKGWKLVDICIDQTALADAFQMKAKAHTKIDTIWIFEKEKSRLNQSTEIYEGAIIEYFHKVKSTVDGEFPCRDWRPVIAGMGVSGWELATIIQTPLLVQTTFHTYTMKVLMFFQRKIYVEHTRKTLEYIRREEYRRQYGYVSRFGRRSMPAEMGEPKKEQEPKKYYNYTLQRYVIQEEGEGDDDEEEEEEGETESVSQVQQQQRQFDQRRRQMSLPGLANGYLLGAALSESPSSTHSVPPYDETLYHQDRGVR